MGNVFISYTTDDELAASQVADSVRRAGHEIFFAPDRKDGIPPGEKWFTRLFSELRACDAVVFLNSDKARASQWCHTELAFAQDQGKWICSLDLASGLPSHTLIEGRQSIRFESSLADGIQRLIESLERNRPAGISRPRLERGRPPYPGLLAMDQADAGVFFGRDAELRSLIGRVEEHLRSHDGQLLVMIGPSGSGKSSLVRAGLAARLKLRPEWVVVHPFEPGSKPFDELVRRLGVLVPAPLSAAELLGDGMRTLAGRLLGEVGPEAKRLLVVVDQAEQLTTLTTAGERVRFLSALGRGLGTGSPVTVVLTTRSDHLEELQGLPVIGQRVQAPFVISPLSRSQLGAVIEAPAARVGLAFAPGLTARLIDDATRGSSGETVDALPLLAVTLRAMYDFLREGQVVFTDSDYESVGRIDGAILRSTDAVEADVTRAKLPILDELLPRLVTVTEDRPRGRPVPRNELSRDEQDIVEKLRNHRLLIDVGDAVRLAHEQLISAWPRLKKTIEERRDDLLWLARVQRQADDWAHKRGGLLGPDATRAAKSWLGRYAQATKDVSDYIRRSDWVLHRRRWVIRGTVSLIAALSLVAWVVAGVAIDQRRVADGQTRVARSGQLASLSEQDVDDNAVTAALLSGAAWEEAHTPQAEDSMLQVLSQPVRAVLTEGGPFNATAFSRIRGGLLVTAGRSLVVWRLATNQRIAPPVSIPGPGGANGVAASPSGTLAATADGDGTVRFWNVLTGREAGQPIHVGGGGVNAVAFDPSDGGVLATAERDGTARLWDVRTRRQIGSAIIDGGTITDSTRAMADVTFSPNGVLLATANDDGTARLWDVATQRQVGHPMSNAKPGLLLNPMLAVAFSPSGTVLATAEDASGGGLWKVASQQRIMRSFDSGPSFSGLGGAEDVVFSPNGLVAIAGANGSAWIWAAATGILQVPTPYATQAGAMRAVTFGAGPGGMMLATVSLDGAVRLWTVTNFWNFTQISVGVIAGGQTAFSRDGSTVATVGIDGAVRSRNLVTSRQVGATILHRQTGGVSALAVSPDGAILATGDQQGTVRLWNPVSGRQMGATITVSRTGAVSALAFNSNGTVLAIGDADGTVRLWDPHTGQPVPGAVPAGTAVDALAFSPSGSMLAIAGSAGEVRLWEIASRRLGSQVNAGVPVYALAFSPDGRSLATADGDGTARLWDPSTGQQKGAAMAASSLNSVNSVAFSPDGTFLATAGSDGIARLWDAATQQEVGVGMRGGTVEAGLDAVAFSQGGSALATVGSGVEALWRVAFPSPSGLYQAVCLIAGRSLTHREWDTYIPSAPYIDGCP